VSLLDGHIVEHRLNQSGQAALTMTGWPSRQVKSA
jgi:hypothetical protein